MKRALNSVAFATLIACVFSPSLSGQEPTRKLVMAECDSATAVSLLGQVAKLDKMPALEAFPNCVEELTSVHSGVRPEMKRYHFWNAVFAAKTSVRQWVAVDFETHQSTPLPLKVEHARLDSLGGASVFQAWFNHIFLRSGIGHFENDSVRWIYVEGLGTSHGQGSSIDNALQIATTLTEYAVIRRSEYRK
jgi:hypothetical protein